jgi:uncharacterized glyoxalase superfamily protein PhnB
VLQNRSMPGTTVIPVLIYEDVPEAVEWLCDTFGFAVRLRVGDHRVQLTIGDGAVVVSERRVTQTLEPSDPVILRPPHRGEASHTVMVRVEDVDAHYDHARQSGTRILDRPADQPYGERQYTAEDLEGHRWTFSQSIADLAPQDWGGELVGSSD